MFKIKEIGFLSIFIFSCFSCFSQNYIDSILHYSDVLFVDNKKLDSLNITTIYFLEFLTKQEKESPEINKMIFSKEYTFKYKNGLLVEKNWSYSGIDSKGTDHFEKKTVGFKPYSFVYEDYYVYDSANNLIRIDQNTPHTKGTEFHVFDRIDIIKINDIPARDYLLSYFTEIYRIIIELNKNQYLDFEID